jgi:hypothetical protein
MTFNPDKQIAHYFIVIMIDNVVDNTIDIIFDDAVNNTVDDIIDNSSVDTNVNRCIYCLVKMMIVIMTVHHRMCYFV